MATRLVLMVLVASLSLGVEAQDFVTTLPSSSPGTPDGSSTCSALQQIAENSAFCSTGESCTQIQCTVQSVTTRLTVLPCETTPSIAVVVDYYGIIVYRRTFSHSVVVPVTSDGITIMRLNITLVDSPNLDSMTLMVVALPTILDPVTLIPATTIPISRAQCFPGFTPPPLPSSTHSSSSSSTSSPPPHAQTCQALQGIASASVSQCTVEDSCTVLDCNILLGYTARLTILPCSKPPAIGVVAHDISGTTIIDETLVQSRIQPVTVGGIALFDLIINITHVTEPPAIILQISARSESLPDIVVVPMTTIPIDYSSCSGFTTISTASTGGSGGIPSTVMSPSTQGSSTESVKTSSLPSTTSTVMSPSTLSPSTQDFSTESAKTSSLLIEVLVPVFVVSLLLMVAVVVVVVVVAVVCSSRKRAHNFHRMTFNNAAEEDEEDE